MKFDPQFDIENRKRRNKLNARDKSIRKHAPLLLDCLKEAVNVLPVTFGDDSIWEKSLNAILKAEGTYHPDFNTARTQGRLVH